MKNILFLGLITFTVMACTQNTPSNQTAALPQPAVMPQVDSNAVYVVSDFYNDIAKTKSPYAASKTAKYVLFGFSLTPTKLKGYSVHEGGYDADIQFDPKANKYIGQEIPGIEPFEFTIAANGNIQMTFMKSKQTYTYQKVTDTDSALREVLFAGNYTDAKTKTPVIFRVDGTLTGLGTDKTYQAVYDYMGGPLDFDELIIQEKSDPDKVSYFHYKFKENTLELYEAIQPKENDAEGLEKIGKLKYTLVKQ